MIDAISERYRANVDRRNPVSFWSDFVIKVRKANNRAEEEEEHGELGVHLLLLICFPQRPNTSPEN